MSGSIWAVSTMSEQRCKAERLVQELMTDIGGVIGSVAANGSACGLVAAKAMSRLLDIEQAIVDARASQPALAQGDDKAIADLVRQKLTSGNSVPVDRSIGVFTLTVCINCAMVFDNRKVASWLREPDER